MNENARMILDYLKRVYPTQMTAQEIVAALNCHITVAHVTGTVNGLVKKSLAKRVEVEVESEGKKPSVVKYITLTDEGLNYDPDAVKKEKE